MSEQKYPYNFSHNTFCVMFRKGEKSCWEGLESKNLEEALRSVNTFGSLYGIYNAKLLIDVPLHRDLKLSVFEQHLNQYKLEKSIGEVE